MSAAERRTQILDVTLRIVDRDGFAAATPARIAEEAGIHRSLLYQQFGDVPGLFVALIDREQSRAGQMFAEAVARASGRGVARMSSVLAGVVRAVDEAPATWRLFLVPPEGAPPEYHHRLEQSQRVVRRYLTHALEESGLSVADPELTARALQAAGRDLLQFRLAEPRAASADRLLRFAQRYMTVVSAADPRR